MVDDDRVTYYPMLDFVPSAELCSSSLNDSSGSESIVASPPLILDLHISVELPHMTEVSEVEAAEKEITIETEAHVASPEG
jgi:hypothetical protein